MLFMTSEFSDLSIYQYSLLSDSIIFDIRYSYLDIGDARLQYFAKNWIFIETDSSLGIVLFQFTIICFLPSFVIVREFFIDHKFYFFNFSDCSKGGVLFWLLHIFLRVILNILYVIIYILFFYYKIIYLRFYSFIGITGLCYMFFIFFKLWYSAIGVFFMAVTLAVYGYTLITYYNMFGFYYFMQDYWLDFVKSIYDKAQGKDIVVTKLMVPEEWHSIRFYVLWFIFFFFVSLIVIIIIA